MSVADFVHVAAEVLEKAGLAFGHGTDNAIDETAELLFFACGFRHEDAHAVYPCLLTQPQIDQTLGLLDRRIDERIPAAYLTHRMWFAGHEFYVDERVLVPRSALAELIEVQFSPWIDADRVQTVLDIGTGSGCIAIACALAIPGAQVDAGDVSPDALAVTAMNIERLGVGERVRPVKSDVFAALGERRYDVIVSNPPYVGAEELRSLPTEYTREPVLGLSGGEDGLDIVRRILRGAASHLKPGGILVVEVGNTEDELIDAYPRAPFTWLEFERGDGGVFLLTAEQLAGIEW